ncbi:GntR family transcriptional regulator [Neisseriaceae bacterium JH1-16]|nr:GntR family transcriptional regulator [Neisseriaceae bacterium JH1-16]
MTSIKIMSYIRLIFTLDLFDDKKSGMTSNKLRRQPLYEQIKSLLMRRIAEGEWQANEVLPSEWELAGELAVSQGTVRKALTELVGEGLLYRQQGRGTFVSDIASDWGDGSLVTPGLPDEHPDAIVCELLGCSRVNAAEEIAQRFAIRRAAPLLRVRQLWRVRGRTVALDDALLPAERFDGLDARWVRECGGVYAALQRRFGVRPRLQMEQLRAVTLSREEAQLLNASIDVPVLSVLRLSSSIEGEPIEWRQRYCLTEQLAYTVCRT